MKKTLNDKIRKIKVKKTSPLLWRSLYPIVECMYKYKCGVSVKRNVDLNKYKGKPVIVLSNHSARFDYAFVSFAMKKRPINFVAEENEFHRSKFKFIFRIAHVIPKKNFVPDISTIRNILSLVKSYKDACIALFPCGMNSASGAQQPVMLGTGKLLKYLGIHVLVTRIHGSYLVCPKYALKERAGRVEVELDELFSPDQLANMSEREIDEKIDEALFTDDYEWNKTRQHSYNCKDKAYALHMEDLLYKCPKCGNEYAMSGRDGTIGCAACGNVATLDDKYNLTPVGDSVIPETPREWFDWERRQMHSAVSDPNFILEGRVKLGVLPKYEYLRHNKFAEYVGEGILTLDKTGMTYSGTRNGEKWQVFIPIERLNTLVMTYDAARFFTYASGEFLMFQPDVSGAMRWTFAVEELYRANGGSWKNFAWFDYDKQGFDTK